MAGVIEDLVDGAGLHNLAGVHHVHIVRHLGHHPQVVGDVDDRDAPLLLDAADQLQDLGLDGHIQGGGGLVADQQVGVAGQGDGDDHTLAHAARQLMGVILHPLFSVGDAHLFQQGDGLLPGLFFVHLEVPDHPLHDLFADGHGGVEAGHGVLEHHRDPLAVDVAANPLFVLLEDIHRLGGAVGVVVGKFDGAGVHLGVVGQNAHGRLHGDRFARAGFTHQGHRLAAVQVNVDAADGMHRARGGLEGDVQVAHGQHPFFLLLCHCGGLLTYSSFWGRGLPAGRPPPG